MADLDPTQRLVDQALQCVERARRVMSHPEEALDLAVDITNFAGEFLRWGLGMVPFARDFLPFARTRGLDETTPPWASPPPTAGEPFTPQWAPAEPAPAEQPEEAARPGAETDGGDGASEAAADDDAQGDSLVQKDQLYKVLRVLYDEAKGDGRFLSAREIADAATKMGLPILAGNVRKVLRTRAARHVETRLREGENGKVSEFRLTGKGRAWFQKNYPVQ